jgi:drug/metabolite transporter (DMT)-like permease
VAYLAFVFVCLVWGSTFIFIERVTHALGPVEIGVWRLLSGAAALGAIWLIVRRKQRFSPGDWLRMLAIALLANSLPHVALPYVLARGFGHSFFGTLVALIPLITIVVSVPMLGIWPTRRQLVGVLGGLVCIVVMMTDGVERGMSLGLLALGIFVPLTSAVSNTYIKWKLSHLPAVPMTTAILASAGLMLLPLEFCRPALDTLHLAGPAVHGPRTVAIVYVLLLGMVGTGISTAVYVWLILKEGPLFAGMTTYVVPVLALVWGGLDHETITPWQLAAMAGALAMVALVQARPAQARTSHPSATPVLPPAIEPALAAADPAAGPLAQPASVVQAAAPPTAPPHQAA